MERPTITPPPTVTPPAAPGGEPGRSLLGPACLVCRSRKVRCDKAIPACRNCVRLGVVCPGYDEERQNIPRNQMAKSTEDIFRAAGKEKRKVGSCEQCRSTKSLCTRNRPSCKRCILRGLSCVYRTKLNRSPAAAQLSGRGTSVPSSPSQELWISNVAAPIVPGLEADYQQLCSETLPQDAGLRFRLISTYFDRIHPLRCLAFIHKPSFLHALDCDRVVEDYGEPLLYIMCALGARLIFLDSVRSGTFIHPPGSKIPGDAWAEKARKDVLSEALVPSVQHLMALVLLCEYGLRADQNAMVYVLCGYLFRAIQLLGLVSPHQQTTAPGSTSEVLDGEVEKRVVWASYQIDLLLASGVDKNSLWRGDFPHIPLPCADRDFLSPIYITPRFLPDAEDHNSLSVVGQLDLPSLVIVLIKIRATVLRLIRTAPQAEPNISDPSSPFMGLIRQLETFYDHIPDIYRLTPLNSYIHKEQNIAGAVFFLHMIYHAAVFDLTRISLAGFSFPLAGALAGAPPEFRADCQKRCRFHANEVSNVIRQGFRHGAVAFDQPFCADVALESAKIQIIYTSTVATNAESVELTKSNLRTNLQLLNVLHSGRDGSSPYIRAIIPLCMIFGLQDIAVEWRERHISPDSQAEVTGSAEIHHLSTIAPFRMARSEVRAKQVGSTSPETISSGGQTSSPNISVWDRSQQPLYNLEERPSPQAQFSTTNQELAAGAAPTDQHPIHDIGAGGVSVTTQDALMQPGQPSIEDYIRTADEMGDYLTWDVSDLSELPSWITFDLPYLPS